MIFPYRSDIWRSLHDGKVPAQTAFIEVAAAISRFEQVFVFLNSFTAITLLCSVGFIGS